MFVTGTEFIYIALLLVLLLLVINVAVYALLVLSLLMITLLSILVYTAGLQIYAILLFSAELHIIYILFACVLLWNCYDSVLLEGVRAANVNSRGRLLVFIVIILFVALLEQSFVSCYHYNVTNYGIQLILSQQLVSTAIASGSTQAILTNLVYSYLTINSFEFLILNIYMLLAIYLFYFIKLANVSAERLVVARRILYIRGGVLYVTPRRRQTQSRQLLRCAGTYSRGL